MPTKLTMSGEPIAFAFTVSEPVRTPLAIAVKVTFTLQTEFGATAEPQLLICAKSPAVVIAAI